MWRGKTPAGKHKAPAVTPGGAASREPNGVASSLSGVSLVRAPDDSLSHGAGLPSGPWTALSRLWQPRDGSAASSQVPYNNVPLPPTFTNTTDSGTLESHELMRIHIATGLRVPVRTYVCTVRRCVRPCVVTCVLAHVPTVRSVPHGGCAYQNQAPSTTTPSQVAGSAPVGAFLEDWLTERIHRSICDETRFHPSYRTKSNDDLSSVQQPR